jgi:antitoxin HicB
MRQFTYTVKLTSDKDDCGYVVTCRDLPEAITQRETREEVLAEGVDCLKATWGPLIGQ